MTGIFSDIDGTMLGDAASLKELNAHLQKVRGKIRLVYASGRSFPECISALESGMLLAPDAFIAYTGAAIYFNVKGTYEKDRNWEKSINTGGWDQKNIRKALSGIRDMTPQPEIWDYKVSYFVTPGELEKTHLEAKAALAKAGAKARVITSHEIYLDVLPEKCDKGLAAEYTAEKLGIKKENTVVAGDSGNDVDMFSRFKNGIIVGNAREEMVAMLKDTGHYKAKQHFASGVLEGLEYYFPKLFRGNI
jgi:sucrose-phosphate synthase